MVMVNVDIVVVAAFSVVMVVLSWRVWTIHF